MTMNVLLNVLLIGVVTIFSITILQKANNKLLYDSIASSLSYSGKEIERTLDNALTLTNMMIADDIIQKQLTIIDDGTDYILRGNAYRFLYSTTQNYYSEFKRHHITYITIKNPYFTTNTYIHEALLPPTEIFDEVQMKAAEAKGSPVWTTRYIKDYGLFLSRSIRKIENLSLKPLGVLTINIDLDALVLESTHFANQYETSKYLIFDEDNLIYHSQDLSYDSSLSVADALTTNYRTLTLDDTEYFAVKGSLPNLNWTYICLVSYEQTQKAISLAYLVFIGFTFAFVILSIFLSNGIVKIIVHHLDNLILKMQSFRGHATEQIDVGYDYTLRTDEFGLLHQQFDSMAEEIQELIQVNYVKELLVKDANYKALEAQMNPHFLYNVLESVNWRAKAIGESQISLMVESLGKLLRVALSEDNDTFTLGKEIDLIESYMSIQLLRFEEQLTYEICVDEAYLDLKLPRFTLQPLVENAIHYGLEKFDEICHIQVHACLVQDCFTIDIINSGSVFPENILERLLSKDIQPHGTGIGLTNIHERLKMMFGSEFGLSCFNLGGQAVARIKIPYKEVYDVNHDHC